MSQTLLKARLARILPPIALAFLFSVLNLSSANSEEVPPTPTPKSVRAELNDIQNSIEVSQERAAAMRAEIADMDGDRTRQSAALIAAAGRVKTLEAEVIAIEDRLSAFLVEEDKIRQRLDGADKKVADLLSALQRISQDPPPALFVDPEDALGSARGALLLSAVLPQLHGRAKVVSENLKQLVAAREAVEAEKATLRASLATLFEEQLRTATLIAARKKGVAELSTLLAEEEQDAAALAKEAKSLGALINELSKSLTGTLTGSKTDRETDKDSLSRSQILTALANTDRKEPAVPFTAAKGFLALPASGVVVSRFGANDGLGGNTKGESMVTRAGAQVIAPADGWVVYKGPYLNYGQIIIINPGNGYSILLAGLETTNVEQGQFVILGEPIGAMGSRTIGRGVTTGAGVSRPTLYIELREQDTPLNPQVWWAEKQSEIRNG